MNFYLTPSEFNSKYPEHEVISKSKRTRVYSTKNSEAIKISIIDWSLSDVCYMSQFNHPNIIKLLHYTFEESDNIYIKYAMPLGEKIQSLYDHPNELLFLIHDITSALKYLKDQGYVYADLKPENIVRIPKTELERAKYVLVDLGFVRPYFNTRDGKFFTGMAYTLPFRDFQFFKSINNINCEIYSLGQTIRCILNNCEPIYSSIVFQDEITKNLTKNFSNITQIQRRKIYDLITKMICKPSERITYEKILTNPIFDSIENFDILSEPQTPVKHRNPKVSINVEKWNENIYKFCFELYPIFNLDIRSMYLVINNTKKCLHLCNNDNILFCIIVNAYLISILFHSATHDYLDLIGEIEDILPSENEFLNMLIKVMEVLQCNFIYKTEWDNCLTENEISTSFAKVLTFDNRFVRISRQIIEKIYPKKKELHLYCSYNLLLENLDIRKTFKNVQNCIDKEFFPLKKNNIWFDYSSLSEKANYKSLFRDNDSIQNTGILNFLDEKLISDQETGNSFIISLMTFLPKTNLDRYSYYLDMQKLRELSDLSTKKLNSLKERNNLYLLIRNETPSPIIIVK